MDFREAGWVNGLDRSGSGEGQLADCWERGNEPSCSIKCGEFLEQEGF